MEVNYSHRTKCFPIYLGKSSRRLVMTRNTGVHFRKMAGTIRVERWIPFADQRWFMTSLRRHCVHLTRYTRWFIAPANNVMHYAHAYERESISQALFSMKHGDSHNGWQSIARRATQPFYKTSVSLVSILQTRVYILLFRCFALSNMSWTTKSFTLDILEIEKYSKWNRRLQEYFRLKNK